MGLSDCFPVGVPVSLGGETRLVLGLRLCDLGRLEAWARAAIGEPEPDWGDEADPLYPERLKAAYLAADRRRPELGTPEVDDLIYGTVAGRALMILLACRADPSPLTEQHARDLAEAATCEEWRAFDRVALRLEASSYVEASRRIDRHLGLPEFEPDEEDHAKLISWDEAVSSACLEWGRTIDEVGELDLAQWRILRTGGKAPTRSDPMPAYGELWERVADARARFWNASPSPDEGGTGDE